MAGQPGEWPGMSPKAVSKLVTASQFEKLRRGAELTANNKPVAKSKRAAANARPTSGADDAQAAAAVATITTIGKQLDQIVKRFRSQDWMERREALQDITRIIANAQPLFCNIDEKKRVRTMELSFQMVTILQSGLVDGNSKVNIVALHTLEDVISKLGNSVSAVTQPLLEYLLKMNNRKVKALSRQVVGKLVATVDDNLLFKPLVNILNGTRGTRNQPLKAELLILLNKLVPNLSSKHKRMLSKDLPRLTVSLYEDATATELISACQTLLQSIRGLHRKKVDKAIERLSQIKKDRLMSVLV